MRGRAETIYNELQNLTAINALIGQIEDAHFDCKEWHDNERDQQKMLAKAACGFANADGGVLIIGMTAKSLPGGQDKVQSAKPVENTSKVKSRVMDLIGQLVEPGIEGVEATEINEANDPKSGFVVVYIPASEGPPRRSRKDKEFYLRIGSGTFPMEYFQIEAMFGIRPRPKLELYLEPTEVPGKFPQGNKPPRWFVLGLRNVGRGIARFPGIRFSTSCGLTVDTGGIDGRNNFGIPLRPSESNWVIFRGGVDDVIYPDETRAITKVSRHATDKLPHVPTGPEPGYKPGVRSYRWKYPLLKFSCEIYCEGIQASVASKSLEEDSLVLHEGSAF